MGIGVGCVTNSAKKGQYTPRITGVSMYLLDCMCVMIFYHSRVIVKLSNTKNGKKLREAIRRNTNIFNRKKTTKQVLACLLREELGKSKSRDSAVMRQYSSTYGVETKLVQKVLEKFNKEKSPTCD